MTLDTRAKKRITMAAIAVVVAGVGLLASTFVGPWSPVLHYACIETADSGLTVYAWVPSLMINSPFGGDAWGNGTVPNGSLSGTAGQTVYSLGIANGSAQWAGFRASISVIALENATQWGPARNSRCSAPYSISVRFWGGYVLGGPLLGAGNFSDTEEPLSLGHWTYPGDVNLSISNAYTVANHEPVSTCGTSASSTWTVSTHFMVGVPVPQGAAANIYTVSLDIQEDFHYWFPSDFGTWQIDNLSAPGGPGGGWAFNYLGPCT